MQYFAVILAAAAAYGFAAFWYTRMSKAWVAAAGIPVDATAPLPDVVDAILDLLALPRSRG